MTPLYLYLALINIVLFCVMGADKRAAQRKRRRVPEATLLTLAILGGSVGGIFGMLVFRHKTKHPKFFIGYPLILLAQIALLYLLKLPL